KKKKKKKKKIAFEETSTNLNYLNFFAVDSAEESGSEESESGSSGSSYSSDDDVEHVNQYVKRKHKQKATEKTDDNDSRRNSRSKGVFKMNEIGMWNEGDLDIEKTEMFKELAKLMVTAAVSNVTPNEDSTLQAMSETRKATLSKLVDSTPKDNKPMTFELSELRKEDDEETGQYDPEIIKYLQDLMGNDEHRASGLTTPSMSMVMNNMWTQEDLMREDENENGEVTLHLPETAFGKDKKDSQSPSAEEKNTPTEEKAGQSADVLSQMKEGTTLVTFEIACHFCKGGKEKTGVERKKKK
ncbi:pre-rRNA processing and ribosome biogenesis protein, partial [Reticulomyxa filosa]